MSACTPTPCTHGSRVEYTITSDNGHGRVEAGRRYDVYRPKGLGNSPQNKVPAVLIFKAGSGSGGIDVLEAAAGLDPVADANGFILIFLTKRCSPCLNVWRREGTAPVPLTDPSEPNYGNDEPYVRDVLAEVIRRENVDASRIYATGGSDGAFMAIDVACDRQYGNAARIRGVGIVSGSLTSRIGSNGPLPPRCESTTKSLSVISLSGGRDGLVPYGGADGTSERGGRAHLFSQQEMMEFWRGRLRCNAKAQTNLVGSPNRTTKIDTWSGCAVPKTAARLIYVPQGGHNYVGITQNGNGIQPAQELWAFWSSHTPDVDLQGRTISLRLSGHLVAQGRVAVAGGSPVCASRVPVQIQRLRSGSWKRVRAASTSPKGTYRVTLPNLRGTFRAVAQRARRGGETCATAVSPLARR